MKSKIYIFLLMFGSFAFFGQTVSNFNCNDCSGTNHDLFTDLDAGKVVVITWVMPCANCINGALTAQTEVQNALSANPGKVIYYLADDVGNTNCTTLSNWASTNGITIATIISNSNVSMTPYGAAGMPKIIVVGGGSNHTVFYNQNGSSITATGIKNAMDAAIAASTTTTNTTGLSQNQKNNFSTAKIFPNPSAGLSKISLNLLADSKIKIEIQNELGQKVSEVFNGNLEAGEHTFNVKTQEFANGNYFVSFSDGKKSAQQRFIVAH